MLRSLLKNVGRRRPASPAPVAPQPGAASEVPALTYQRGGQVIAATASSEGDALKEIMLELLEPLRPLCAGAVLLDLNDPQFRAKLAAAAEKPVWFALSFFGGGEHIDGQSPWAKAGVPFVRIFGDTPAYYPHAHFQQHPNSINGYGHREHQEFFCRWFPQRAPCLWMPFYPFDTVEKGKVDFSRKERGSIIFPKNGNCPDRLRHYWRDSLPPAVAQALEAASEEADARLDEPFETLEYLRKHFGALGIDLVPGDRLMFFLVAQIDDYLRRRKSTLVGRALLDLPVVIRGVNWDHVDFHGRKARHDPDSDFARTRPLLDECLAIVDMTPNTYRGTHDRALRAAGRYTAFLTNRQPFYVETFSNHAQFTYRFDEHSVRERVEAALARPRDTVEMGVAQAERMRELRKPEDYVRELLAVVDVCAMACAPRPPGTQNFVHYPQIVY